MSWRSRQSGWVRRRHDSLPALRRSAVRWSAAVLLPPGSSLSRLIGCRLTGNGVLLGEPAAEVDELATLAAERPERGLRPVDLAVTGGAFHSLDGHHAQQVRRNFTSESACV